MPCFLSSYQLATPCQKPTKRGARHVLRVPRAPSTHEGSSSTSSFSGGSLASGSDEGGKLAATTFTITLGTGS